MLVVLLNRRQTCLVLKSYSVVGDKGLTVMLFSRTRLPQN